MDYQITLDDSHLDYHIINKYKSVGEKYNINTEFLSKLEYLEGKDVVLILDDSGSMMAGDGVSYDSQFSTSRWNEMFANLNIMMDIISIACPKGIDIHFLNRKSILKVKSFADIQNEKYKNPSGNTPLINNLKNVFSVPTNNERLVIIITDGRPTDGTVKDFE